MTWFVSGGIICATFAICDFTRVFLLSSSSIPPRSFRLLLGDFLVSIELCVGSLETSVILEQYGLVTYSTCLFGVILYQRFRFRENIPSAIVHFDSWLVRKRVTIIETLVRVAILGLFGFVAFRFVVSTLWALGLNEIHVRRSRALSACSIWDSWNPITAFVAEFAGCFVLTLGSLMAKESERIFVSNVIYAAFAVIVILAAFDVSGGMYNPVLASLLLGGCRGHSISEHVFVYWIGATFGALTGSKVFRQIRQFRREKVE